MPAPVGRSNNEKNKPVKAGVVPRHRSTHAKVSDQPKFIKPFVFHGVEIAHKENMAQGNGDCPLCSKAGKFYVQVDTGMWDCKSCGQKGNIYTFLRLLHDMSIKGTTTTDYSPLLNDRKLLSADTLSLWGVARSALTGDWIVPGYGNEGKINNLYKYIKDSESGKMFLAATPSINQQLFGYGTWDPKKREVHVTEGPWDGMAWYEALRATKKDEDGYHLTSNEEVSLLADINVVAVPGCNVFRDDWGSIFEGKIVTLLYDNDHPGTNKQTGAKTAPAGWTGCKKAVEIMVSAERPPLEIRVLHWGEIKKGQLPGYDPKLISGYDVRDALVAAGSVESSRIKAVPQLLGKVVPIPPEWATGRTPASRKKGGTDLQLIDCESYAEVLDAFKKAMFWNDGLDNGLPVMLSCAASTNVPGNQLWVKVIGPPSCGKTTLADALSANKKHVKALSSIRGFHSGYKTDKDGDDDNSLIDQLWDRTLITKDGDTLLKAPNRAQILAEARDIYDGNTSTDYRNGIQRTYDGLRMTWILCGTSSLREIDESDLGERFLDVVIMDGIDADFEDQVLWNVANRVQKNIGLGVEESKDDQDMLLARQLTGGYLNYLKRNMMDLLASISVSDEAKRKVINMAKFVAHMRCRPSKTHTEKAEREFSARLVNQHLRLANCLAVVLNKTEVDADIIKRTTKVALDTSRGVTLDMARHMIKAGERGLDPTQIAIYTNQKPDRTKELLRFLKHINVAEYFIPKLSAGVKGQPRWRLTQRFEQLYRAVGAPLE